MLAHCCPGRPAAEHETAAHAAIGVIHSVAGRPRSARDGLDLSRMLVAFVHHDRHALGARAGTTKGRRALAVSTGVTHAMAVGRPPRVRRCTRAGCCAVVVTAVDRPGVRRRPARHVRAAARGQAFGLLGAALPSVAAIFAHAGSDAGLRQRRRRLGGHRAGGGVRCGGDAGGRSTARRGHRPRSRRWWRGSGPSSSQRAARGANSAASERPSSTHSHSRSRSVSAKSTASSRVGGQPCPCAQSG